MTVNSSGSALFAGRYRFQPVSNDWDRGRSGYTHLVFDTVKERLGVIKRAEIKSLKDVEGLKNEVGALLDLKGAGVPEVYDTGEAEYGSKKYFYIVIEYIEGLRVEKNLPILSAMERAKIITQLFGLLAKAHKLGIANRDIDLKHLFWRSDRQQLVVIDWGNAKLHVDAKQESDFAFDLARSAEIIYCLVTSREHPPATGGLVLPKDSAVVKGLAPIPREFRELCKWSPRTPSQGRAPYTAVELLEVSKTWNNTIKGGRNLIKPSFWQACLLPILVGLLALLIFFTLFDGLNLIRSYLATPTPNVPVVSPTTVSTAITDTLVVPTAISPTETLIESTPPTPSLTPTIAASPTPSITDTSTPIVIPSPVAPGRVIQAFDQNSSSSECWASNLSTSTSLKPSEGFTRREDENWRFWVEKSRTAEEYLETDFSQCLNNQPVTGMAVNMWVPRLELQRDYTDIKEPGKEIGFFIEDTNRQRREYTIWIDAQESMHLRIREDGNITHDDIVSIVNLGNLKIKGQFPRYYAEFPIQIFLEINNNGSDVIYLKEGPIQEAVDAESLDPSQMIRIDTAVRPAMGDIQKIGLIGYGGETQTVIWPLAFFGITQ